MEQIDRVQVKDDDLYLWEFLAVSKEQFDSFVQNGINVNDFDEHICIKFKMFCRVREAKCCFVIYYEISKTAPYIIYARDKNSEKWVQKSISFEDLSKWFRKINGADGNKSKELGAVKDENTDDHVMRIMKQLYNDNTYSDDSGVELTKALLNGDQTMGVDLDLAHFVESTNEFLIFEFLFRDKKQPAHITTITSHPMRYSWNDKSKTDNRQKFISLWRVKQKLNGRLFLVNYSDSTKDKISVMEVLELDENKGIKSEIKCCMYYNMFVGWLKDISDYSGTDKDYMSDLLCVEYDESFFVEFERNRNDYGRIFSEYYKRLVELKEIGGKKNGET